VGWCGVDAPWCSAAFFFGLTLLVASGLRLCICFVFVCDCDGKQEQTNGQ
jgi:hypothetical protein